jgi:hypothetical protein
MWEAGMPTIKLLGFFLASNLHLFGVDDYYIITAIQVRAKFGLVLAAQHIGHFGCQATKSFAIGID